MTSFDIHIQQLDKCVEALYDELKILKPRMLEDKMGMFITHDEQDTILVYSVIEYKAYVPKNYDGWRVLFIEASPDDDDGDIEG